MKRHRDLERTLGTLNKLDPVQAKLIEHAFAPQSNFNQYFSCPLQTKGTRV